MKKNKKLVKRGLEKQKIIDFNTKFTHKQQHLNPRPKFFEEAQKQIASIKTRIQQRKESKRKSNDIQIKRNFPSSKQRLTFDQINRVKSSQKFTNYKSLITAYEQQRKQSFQNNLPQKESSREVFNLKYESSKLLKPQISKHEACKPYLLNREKQKNEQKNNEIAKKKKQIQHNYIRLQEKYKQILIETKNQLEVYESQKNKLLSLKSKHFQDQNLLQSLRSHYFTRQISKNSNNIHDPLKHKTVQTKDELVQTQNDMKQSKTQLNHPLSKKDATSNQKKWNLKNFQNSKPQLDQSGEHWSEMKYQNKMEPQRKHKTQSDWFQLEKHELIENYRNTQQIKQLNSPSKRRSTYSEKSLEGKILERQKFDNLQEEEDWKSRISKKQKLYPSINYGQLRESILQNQETSQKSKETPRLSKFNDVMNKDLPKQKVKISASAIKQNRSTQFDTQWMKNNATEVKTHNLKVSRQISQKSMKSVKKGLFTSEKSNYLNQFRKEVKNHLASKKENPRKDFEHIKTVIRPDNSQENQKEFIANLRKSRKKQHKEVNQNHLHQGFKASPNSLSQENYDNFCLNPSQNPKDFRESTKFESSLKKKGNTREQASEFRQQNLQQIAPQTPKNKYYQSRKPISPNQALNKYRFTPSIKIQ